MGRRLRRQHGSGPFIDPQGSRSHSLSDALKKLFSTMTKLNTDLHLTFVPSFQNQADPPSRPLTPQDAKLCPSLWVVVQELFGGEDGHCRLNGASLKRSI